MNNRNTRNLLLLMACLVAPFASLAPASAQVAEQEISTRETVFTAPGLGRAVSIYENVVIAGGEETVKVFQRDTLGWVPTATLTASDGAPGDEFGAAVALSGAFAVIGAPGAEVGGYAGAGAAYVFQALADGSWVQRARLVSGSPAAGARFGAAVSVAAQLYFAIGSPGAGQATVFEPLDPGNTWMISAELTAPDLGPDDAVAAGFGTSADVSVGFGVDFVVVGAPGADGSGAVYAYRRVGPTWNFDAKLVDNPRTAAGRFGQTVSTEATSVLIGAPGAARTAGFLLDPNSGQYTPIGNDLGGSGFGVAVGSGSARGIAGDPAHRIAYIYARGDNGGVLAGTLAPAMGASDDAFGSSVDVQTSAVVGAPGADTIHIFERGTSETSDHLDLALGAGLSYQASGDLYGQFSVLRDGDRVLAIKGRGRLLSGTTPSPFVAIDLRQLGGSGRMVGNLTISEPATGFDHALDVNTSARAVSVTATAGRGIVFEPLQRPQRRVKLEWTLDDLLPSPASPPPSGC
jgi:hypothetical protein